MSKAFDIGISALAGPGEFAHANVNSAPPLSNGKSFFIETFGCQMNVHDSEKVAGVFLAHGYRAAASIAEADVMLYNTCSIREKAAQKVFSRLGEWRGVPDDKIIGVIGCLAQQEGEDIFERDSR